MLAKEIVDSVILSYKLTAAARRDLIIRVICFMTCADYFFFIKDISNFRDFIL